MTINQIRHFISARRLAGRGGRSQGVRNPATGDVSGQVALATGADVAAAVAAAKAAFPEWADTPPIRRAARQARAGARRGHEPHAGDARRGPRKGHRCADRRGLRVAGERCMAISVARLVVDGRGHGVAGHDQGFRMGGTLFDHVTPEMTICREEIFGPVLSFVRVDDVARRVALINAHEFGKGVRLFTRDGTAVREFGRKIQVGMVGINVPIPVPVAYFSFTGSRASKLGDLGPNGKQAIAFWTQTKTVTARWFEPENVSSGINSTISLG